jgi:hypothetical protein
MVTWSVQNIEQLRQALLSKCDGFVDVQIWPPSYTLDPQGWLSNFREEELPFALALLDSFVYFSEPMVDRLLEEAFTKVISQHVRMVPGGRVSVERNRVCFTHVTGPIPRVTDSGQLIARKVRQVLRVPETDILSPRDTVRGLLASRYDTVVIVDDLLGSGDQFFSTWVELHDFGALASSFEELSGSDVTFYFMPLVAV